MCRHGRQNASIVQDGVGGVRRFIQSTFDAQPTLFDVVLRWCFYGRWPVDFRLVALEFHVGGPLAFVYSHVLNLLHMPYFELPC
jgi:hypothetical protein